MSKKEDVLRELKKKMEYMNKKTNYNVAIMFLYGSQNYGLDSQSENYQSDYDVKCFIVPTLEELLEDKKMVSTTIEMEDKSKIDVKDIRTLPQLLAKLNISYLELLYTPYFLVNNEYRRTKTLIFNKNLREMKSEICNRDMKRFMKALSGTLTQKYNEFEKKTETNKEIIDKYGYNPKQLHHLIRISCIVQEVIRLNGKVNLDSLMTLDFLSKAQKKKLLLYKTTPIGYLEATRLVDEYYSKTNLAIDSFIKTSASAENEETTEKMYNLIDEYVLTCVKLDIIDDLKKANKKTKKGPEKK